MIIANLSQRAESNRGPHPYHGCALPTELHWLGVYTTPYIRIRKTPVRRFSLLRGLSSAPLTGFLAENLAPSAATWRYSSASWLRNALVRFQLLREIAKPERVASGLSYFLLRGLESNQGLEVMSLTRYLFSTPLYIFSTVHHYTKNHFFIKPIEI
jgi:hypothetical protein